MDLVFPPLFPLSVSGATQTGCFFFSKASLTDADWRGLAAAFRISAVICVASECLRGCVGMSPLDESSLLSHSMAKKPAAMCLNLLRWLEWMMWKIDCAPRNISSDTRC